MHKLFCCQRPTQQRPNNRSTKFVCARSRTRQQAGVRVTTCTGDNDDDDDKGKSGPSQPQPHTTKDKASKRNTDEAPPSRTFAQRNETKTKRQELTRAFKEPCRGLGVGWGVVDVKITENKQTVRLRGRTRRID